MKTIERVDPKSIAPDETTGWQTLQLHLERYRFASQYARQGLILDIACGVGYGSQLLAQNAAPGAQIVAVDLAQEALAIAQSEYAAPNIEYIRADCMQFAWAMPFDTIVSLETFEHLDAPEKFFEKLIGLCKPDGTIIFSVPITPSVDVNPYHKHDFTRERVRTLIEQCGWSIVDHVQQVQPYSPLKMMLAREERLTDTRKNLLGYYLQAPDKAWLRFKSTLADGFCNKYLTVAAKATR